MAIILNSNCVHHPHDGLEAHRTLVCFGVRVLCCVHLAAFPAMYVMGAREVYGTDTPLPALYAKLFLLHHQLLVSILSFDFSVLRLYVHAYRVN